ncbi:MAG: glutamine synthetase III [Solobacterium sp.]|nr:glutamine synthetase III [Solobacterium sp.]
MEHPFEEFGSMVFGEQEMHERLPNPVYQAWRKALANEQGLDRPTADAIAHAMKRWAMEKGATHYTHWFQPMTGSTAEKHEAFVNPDNVSRMPVTRFSGKSLIKGEPDASSFPNGGLRGTFEARGYTYWDAASPVFIHNNVLCIPTVFVSYNGESLDKKNPLLKSIKVINDAATRIVNILGEKDVRSCKPMCGLEQEYFLIDRDLFRRRTDLRFTGRTLFGSSAPKAQELGDHYLGKIPARAQAFMREVNAELWKLGIFAKTEHNEAAPGQFELASVFNDSNIAVDENQLVMEILQNTAEKHGLACLLAEKPFAGINGSGKHCNFSLTTDTGQNLFSPGDKPAENVRFLVFVCAFIKAVDEYAGLLRLSAASAGCDYRLGGNEAPPVIISVYLGSYIQGILEGLTTDTASEKSVKKSAYDPVLGLAYVPRDNSDRNRTSPVAFTGNKFEFRMVGSAQSGALANTVLNAALAESLNSISDQLEGLKYIQDIREKALQICAEIYRSHKRVVFNGDGYSEEWKAEAARRGLPDLVSCVDVIDVMDDPKSLELFTGLGIYNEAELVSRKAVFIENYINTLSIEGRTLLEMIRTEILPMMAEDWKNSFADDMGLWPNYVKEHGKKTAGLMNGLYAAVNQLDDLLTDLHSAPKDKDTCRRYHDEVITTMEECRHFIDAYEAIAPDRYYTLPKYKDMLFDL